MSQHKVSNTLETEKRDESGFLKDYGKGKEDIKIEALENK